MPTIRIKTRHAKRAFAGAFAACVAATAMAYSSGGWQTGHGDEAPGHHQQGGGSGGGDTPIGTQDSSQDPGSFQVSDGGAPGGGGATTPPSGGGSGGGHPHGHGDHGGSNGPGFMPNGENGLMTLASFAQGFGDHDGDGPGDGGGMGDGGSYFSDGLAGGDGSKDGQNGDGQPGGKGGFGGGGGGGGGGGPGGSNDPGSKPPGGPNCVLGDIFCGSNPGQGPNGGPGGTGPTDSPGGSNNPPITGFNPPVFFDLTNGGGDDPPGPGSNPGLSAAPEPASWLIMILGFGVLGQTLRLRRRFAA